MTRNTRTRVQTLSLIRETIEESKFEIRRILLQHPDMVMPAYQIQVDIDCATEHCSQLIAKELE